MLKKHVYSFKPFTISRCKSNLSDENKTQLPKPRSGHRIVCDDGNLYSFGGYNPENENGVPVHALFKEIWKYNFASQTWCCICPTDMPDELASNAVLLRGCTMLIYGGTSHPFGESCSSTLYVCNVNDFSITQVTATGQIPMKQYGQALVLDGSNLYTIGGTTGHEFTADVHCLDLRTRVWEEIYKCKNNNSVKEPHGRYRHELAFDGLKIYVLGGGTVRTAFGFKDIDAFNIATRTWESISTEQDVHCDPPGYPAPRQFHGCVQLPEDGQQEPAVFICGGYDDNNSYSDLWKLSLKTLRWTCLSECKLPEPIFFHSSAITSYGCMYTFGGVVSGGKRTNRLFRTWLCIPKLAEMCWDAILFYNPNIYKVSKHDLLKSGFPKKFISRLC